jgi:hypothetical protein
MNAQKNNGYQLPKPDKFSTEAFDKWYRSCEYEKACDNCNTVHKLQTQQDNFPEYYTDIFIECKCGNLVHFELPVN